MKIRRTAQAVAVLAAGSLALAACTSPADDDNGDTTGGDDQTEDTGGGDTHEGTDKADLGDVSTVQGDIFFSTGQDEFTGYNTFTSGTYSTYNNVISDRYLSSFWYFGTDGTIYPNEEFGTYEAISGVEDDGPLVIEYTIADDAVWSDGTPVTNLDYMLDWVSQNPEGWLPQGEDSLFDHVSHSFAQYVPEGPQGELGAKTFTIEYAEKNPDWPIIVSSAFPAHVVAEQIGMTAEEFGQAIRDEDVEAMEQAAEFWNTGWLSNPGEVPDESLAPSNGPYRFMEGGWTAGQSITLEANPNYWGTPPATEKVTFRFLDASTHTQSLENGDLNVIEPQATVDTVPDLEALGDAVEIKTGSELTWEHVDFNFLEGNVFADDQGGLALREAFAYCLPREQIVENLIRPIDPEAVVMNAREVFPFQDNYDEVVDAAYDGRFDEVDLDEATRLVEESGITTPIDVRIGYSAPNPRRTAQVEMIKSSCDQAGFNVIDTGTADFFSNAIVAGDYEVALFAWAGSGQITSGENIYATDRPQNYGKFSNADVDAAWSTLASSLDPEVQAEQVKVIEGLLWDNLYGIPIFAHPGVVAHTAGMENVRHTAAQSGVSWNAEQWLLPE
ncbi:ABC transporter substrate-binding protein [Georgenia sunbinii]|uniref:ABC transporter substrate-binding protein n=1 Tax=Georgenia sunbinii TaxID=3117728 RepID=UPI002F25FEA4